MSDSWSPQEPEPERAALPRLEDLPTVPGGYESRAVAAAFDAFYRHAAELDATLRVLESVDAFQKQAGELRADIRALRASSWGPIAAARPGWSPAYSAREERLSGLGEAGPRVALETVFIVLVAVGAFVAGLETVWTVALVAASWVVVGVAEVIASSSKPRLAAPPAPARPAEPAAAPARSPLPEPEPEPEIVDAPSLVLEAQSDPWEQGPDVPEEPEAEEEPAPRRRFRRRRHTAEAPEQADAFPEHDDVRVVEVERAVEPEAVSVTWEGEQDGLPEFPSLTPHSSAPREHLRRGRR
jgi:hypothetical protein